MQEGVCAESELKRNGAWFRLNQGANKMGGEGDIGGNKWRNAWYEGIKEVRRAGFHILSHNASDL